jgi:hypothetical protein
MVSLPQPKTKPYAPLRNTITERIKLCVQDTHGACSSVALVGFALPECHGSSPCVYPALEGLTAVVHRGLVPPPLPGSTLYVHACHPRGALPAPRLAGCPVGRGE